MSIPAVSITNLSLTLRGRVILEDVNLTLQEGAFLGLFGPNGGGKTMLLKLILGLVKPTDGWVKVFGKTPEDARGTIGYVPQFARFDWDFPIRVLDVVLMGRLSTKGLFSRYSQQDYELARRLLSEVEMADLADQPVGKLSGGQLQRVLIARALALEPRLLLLDEPTASLDSKSGQLMYSLLQELSSRITIVLVSHDIGVISEYVNTVACLNRRFHYHHSKQITADMVQEVYGCPVELMAHGVPHRVLAPHEEED